MFATNRENSIDLPAEMQRELRELESRGDALTHYALLGVPVDADPQAIRRAFLEKSKRFHPDVWYRKNLGSFGPLLTKWFQRISGAYQVLCDEESRREYDQEHKDQLSASDKAAVERRELSLQEKERRAREGRERLLRTKGFARLAAGHRLYDEAQQLAAAGDRVNAIAALKAARELDPNRREIAQRLLELEREQARARAQSALVSAREREDQRRFQQALDAYAWAFQNDGTNGQAALGALRCALELADLRAAMTWGTRAVEMLPSEPQAHLLLAKALKALDMKARARAELTLVLRKDPENKEAKALLRGL